MHAKRIPALEVRLLGGLEVRRDGEPVRFPPSRKARALLAYLVATPRPHSRERLCDLLWDHANDPRAELRWSLAKLRRLVDDDEAKRIASDGDRVVFRPHGAWVDLTSVRETLSRGPGEVPLEALEAAVERIRGQFLEGLELPRCLRFDAWCAAEREAVRSLHVAALVALVERHAERPERALGYARRRLAIEPFAEAAHIAIIELLGRLGRTREALEQYDQCRAILARELGARPTPALDAARRALRPQVAVPAPAAAPAPGPSAAAGAGPSAPPGESRAAAATGSGGTLAGAVPATAGSTAAMAGIAPPPDLPPLVGRKAEGDAIRAALEAAAGGAACPVLLFSGAPGIGKTRLLEELAARVRAAGGVVLAGRGYEAELIRPYGAWFDALRGVGRDRIPPALRAELAPLLPELGAMPAESADRNRLFEAVVALLCDLAGDRIAAVVFDDVQWLDEASFALLHFAVRRLEGTRVLFACAVRPTDLDDNAAALRFTGALEREGRLRRIALAPLDAEHTAELVRRIGPALDTARIFRESAGNPLFSLEIARALDSGAGPVSETLEGLIADRLARLSARARTVLPWVAALGHDFTLDVIARVVDLPPSELLGAIEELERRGVLRAEGAGHDFAHDVIRRTAYRRISEPRRRLIHERLAGALAGAARTGRPPAIELDPELAGDVAHHAALGGDDELAARACLGAARRALWLFAFDDAAELIARGIRHATRCPDDVRIELRLELLGLYTFPGMADQRSPDLEGELTRVIGEAKAAGLQAAVQRGFSYLGKLYFHIGDFTRALDRTLRAEEAGRSGDPATVVRAIADTARCMGIVEHDMARAEKLALEAAALDEGIGAAPLEIPQALGLVHHFAGRLDEAVVWLERAVDAARREREHWSECYCLCRLPMIELERGSPKDALARCAELRPVAERLREGSEAPFAEALEAIARLALGEDGADTVLAAALRRLREVDSKARLAYAQIAAGEIELDRGDIEAARARGVEALEAAETVGRASTAAHARALLARCALEAGDRDAAVRWLEPARRPSASPHTLSARARECVEAVARRLEAAPT